jgi:hypothetical protein
MKSFLNFEKLPLIKGLKTDRWNVWTGGKNYDDRGPQSAELGNIHWCNHWRRYVFFPNEGTFFDAKCSHEIGDFCESQTKHYKESPR